MAAQYQINGIRRRLRCDHHCDNRGLWLLVRTRNDGGKARQRPRGGGIKHLADVLDDADFAAVEALVKPLVSSRKNPVNLAGGLPNITVPTGVRVYKAMIEEWDPARLERMRGDIGCWRPVAVP